MTDNDIIKAIEYCTKAKKCHGCPLYDVSDCDEKLLPDALEIINRQKAEIERLQKYNTDMARKHYSDGIKEFAERLKDNCINAVAGGRSYKLITTIWIDNLAKKMTEEQDGNV